MVKRFEAVNHQRRTGEKHDRKRYFTDDQRIPQPPPSRPHAALASALLQRSDEVYARNSQRRDDPEQNSGGQGNCDCECKHAAIQARPARGSEFLRNQAAKKICRENRCEETSRAGRQRQHDALDEKLPRDPRPGRAES